MATISRFRNAARAIIIVDGQLLTICIRHHEAGDYYVLPGGGQLPGETLHETLQRECWEEIGSPVIVHELCFVREYVGRNHHFASQDHDLHQVEFMFRCELPVTSAPQWASLPDTGQLGAVWLAVDHLDAYRFFPAGLRSLLSGNLTEQRVHYLGDLD